MNMINFNEKYEKYLEKGHYGLDIYNEEVVEYLDKEFEKEIKVNPNFSYSQIKMKFGTARIYAESDKTSEWEKAVDQIFDRIKRDKIKEENRKLREKKLNRINNEQNSTDTSL